MVILNRSDYIEKMKSLINDTSTFKVIQSDPTIAQEDRLTLFRRTLPFGHIESVFIYDLIENDGTQLF